MEINWYQIRKCGNTWEYCNGACIFCDKKDQRIAPSNKTDAEVKYE